ncbi:MAG: hypothetical protein OXJ52_01605 [Oligoflexia bacterium]|nr:hypothetical protein [Oligoflexia bacterium]
MKKKFSLCFFFVLFSSCVRTGGSGSNLSSQVGVFVVPFHSNSQIRTASGQPYIRTKGIRQVCRFRPFSLREVRERLGKEKINEEVLDTFLFPEEAGGEGEGESSYGSEVSEPIYHQVGDNWLRFGLAIKNDTNFLLIIDTVRLQARARCGSQIFEHSGEISTGYCSGEAPYLYIVPPLKITGKQVNYYPQSTNPFDNLTLFFDGFPIIDRSGEASKSFQNAFRASGTTTQGPTNNTTASPARAERECQPNKTVVIPQYNIEITLIGYFLLPKGEDKKKEVEQVDHFTKRIRFSTTVVN